MNPGSVVTDPTLRTTVGMRIIVKLRQGSGKERQGKARMAKGERP